MKRTVLRIVMLCVAAETGMAIGIWAATGRPPSSTKYLAFGAISLVVNSAGTIMRNRRRPQRRHDVGRAAQPADLPHEGITSEVVELVAAGKKIHAIKVYRELTGVRLQDAKSVIDALAASIPAE